MFKFTKPRLDVVGWEITFACNMRCKHCGSRCGKPKSDELTTEEALSFCDQLSEFDIGYVTFSGGEPLVRKDWPTLARRLRDHGITVNILSNGWFIDEKIADTALELNVSNIAISLDGLEDTHDFIRTKGSFKRIMSALDTLKEKGISSGIVTSLNSRNIKELHAMKELLYKKGVERWQLQLTEMMGNVLENPELILKPEDISRIIDFAYEVMLEGKLVMDMCDNVGYFDEKLAQLNQRASQYDDDPGIWDGCKAGKSVIGIRCNGDVAPCLSIRDEEFIEGNIKEIPLKEIWNRPDAFSWCRNLNSKELKGFCHECQYAEPCLGGCLAVRSTMSDNLYENKYCIYRVEAEKELKCIKDLDDADELLAKGRELAEDRQFRLAERCLEKAVSLGTKNPESLNLLGFVKYSLDKFDESIELNRRVLEIDPTDAYAHKGLGICLTVSGRPKDGIEELRKAVELADDDFLEPHYDLAVILADFNLVDEAIGVLEKGRKKSQEFAIRSEELYRNLLERKSANFE